MKNTYRAVVLIIVVMIIAFIFSPSGPSGKPGVPILNVITKNESTEEIDYVAICSNRKVKEIDEFISDDVEIYYADSDCFESYISQNKVLNKLNRIALEDSDGNTLDNDEIITGIFESAEKIKHDIWQFQVIKHGDDYYALVKLNVNLHSPCDFYKYDQTEKELKLLYGFDGVNGVDIVGLSFPEDNSTN